MELTHCNVAIPSTFTPLATVVSKKKKSHNYVHARKQPHGIVQYILANTAISSSFTQYSHDCDIVTQRFPRSSVGVCCPACQTKERAE